MTNAGTWQKRLSFYTGGDVVFYEDTGTTPKFFWDASAESLGIGTSSPAPPSGSDTTLEIAGSSSPSLTINDTGQAEKYMLSALSDELRIIYGITSLVNFQNDGNVGIGDDDPDMTTVIAYSDAGTDFNANDFTGGLGIYNTDDTNNTSSAINFKGGSRHDVVRIGAVRTSNSTSTSSNKADFVVSTRHLAGSLGERFRITSNGSVGIGTSSPDGLLTLATANSNTPRFRLQHPTNNADATIDTYYDGSGTYLSIGTNVYQGSSATLTKFDSAKGTGLTYYDSSGQILFFNGGGGASISERMRIDLSGRFLLGTGAAIANAGGAIFQSSQQNNNWTSYIENYISSGNVYGQLIRFSGQSPDNNTSAFLACQDGSGTVRFYVYSDGDVANHDNSYGAISDEKLKEQITDASSQWEDVKALRVRKFKLKEDVSTKGDSDNLWRLGVVAQEVETAGMNGLVKDNPDLIENENGQLVAGNTTTKSVKYSILYMKAVKALQEAMTRIETLETANTALEARIAALETA
jgi:hypothetical protein